MQQDIPRWALGLFEDIASIKSDLHNLQGMMEAHLTRDAQHRNGDLRRYLALGLGIGAGFAGAGAGLLKAIGG